jgi:hypothetical protein
MVMKSSFPLSCEPCYKRQASNVSPSGDVVVIKDVEMRAKVSPFRLRGIFSETSNTDPFELSRHTDQQLYRVSGTQPIDPYESRPRFRSGTGILHRRFRN